MVELMGGLTHPWVGGLIGRWTYVLMGESMGGWVHDLERVGEWMNEREQF